MEAKKTFCKIVFLISLFGIWSCGGNVANNGSEKTPLIKKIKDVVIYEDARFYSCFPSVIRRPNGELLVAFRRAPNKMILGEKRNMHVDSNSYLVMVRSKDAENWTKEPELIYAHPFGGSQDPCLLQLQDGTLLCTSYGWADVSAEAVENLKQPVSVQHGFVFLGGYLVKSTDGGKTWQGPIYPSSVPTEIRLNIFGDNLSAFNRGALYEGKNGIVYWAVAAHTASGNPTSVHLMASKDKGLTWQYYSEIASDEEAAFNETSVYETPKGDIVAFLRTARMEDQACIARSTDGGKSFKWESMGFQGHPLQAVRLNDNRVLLVYGYRHVPFGIRARILNAECTDYKTAPEFILRDDGGTSDIGYPWAERLDENQILVVYYYNKNDGVRHIAGTILEVN